MATNAKEWQKERADKIRILARDGGYDVVDPHAVLTDLLTDLRYYALQHGLDFEDRLDSSARHVEMELNTPAEDYIEGVPS